MSNKFKNVKMFIDGKEIIGATSWTLTTVCRNGHVVGDDLCREITVYNKADTIHLEEECRLCKLYSLL